mmetsp:Transcript_66795/g.127222  ORF Transcript_66795/g.127222 Transcript_66795/m.127222 type:complete len:234 (+) Transcript_66795:296-997(+)
MLLANCSGVFFDEFCSDGSALHRRSAPTVSASFFSTAAWRAYLCDMSDDFFEFTPLKPLSFKNFCTLRLAASSFARSSRSAASCACCSSQQRRCSSKRSCCSSNRRCSSKRNCSAASRACNRSFSKRSASAFAAASASARLRSASAASMRLRSASAFCLSSSSFRSSANLSKVIIGGEFSLPDANKAGSTVTLSATGSAVRHGPHCVLQVPNMVANRAKMECGTKAAVKFACA